MGKVKQINIKNGTYYFYNDQINWKVLMQGCSPWQKGLQRDWHLLHWLCGC